ncbi:hypothetical protein ASPWEDRAFT_43043 [Aspergillus wentii DTO 134E9]|uniref:Uncharacterized protein n=1 Tax=Aspergillus wentii DTO 134E9 TaxID=1073089 RepID=A0A1L9RDK3_ASPWE|nr:uncharacterized protein ASPWEDRAFT_43043 [Aspergillus wentii DTO 134E9]OJJ33002.1 hypothetical protein ASPWEDRAFT_43043 [Aspergillus wentii DTO 134E9]
MKTIKEKQEYFPARLNYSTTIYVRSHYKVLDMDDSIGCCSMPTSSDAWKITAFYDVATLGG